MIIGDKIRLVHKMGVFDNIGEVCEVTEIQDGGVICFKFGGGKHLGCMSYDEYQKYFEKVEEPTKRKWTEWEKDEIAFHNIYGNSIVLQGEYRSNGNKVEFRGQGTTRKCIKSIASCCPDDKFELHKGLLLAKQRFVAKYISQQVKDIANFM